MDHPVFVLTNYLFQIIIVNSFFNKLVESVSIKTRGALRARLRKVGRT